MAKRLKRQYPAVATVSGKQHIGMVEEIFSTIPERYDFLNHLMSFSMDRGWRKFTVKKMCFFRTYRFLDIATGTGDLAITAACTYPNIKVAGLDFAREMMAVGTEKVEHRHLSGRIAFLQGDAMQIPLPDKSVDVTAVAFGIRNMPDRKRALKEMRRVTTPGGQVMVLEMNYPQRSWWTGFYRFYLKRIMPWIAAAFTRNPAAYRYLSDSIMNFPQPDAFGRLMQQAGLKNIVQYPLTLGTTYLHVGERPHE
ncbi:MAG: bifunctional demethylmenaquinone methyltransferase/2-methoxy-6-polyprenyl-1,4-benzoquinol methylase UbiE [Syntrophaceae bacterium]|nr:bifunctional demethylmenaquinone methyltransferase/2-methoxy-6-polyprenyl-1,4-benzoquinol methylase UbiE [Syntrophaceae bacterium]